MKRYLLIKHLFILSLPAITQAQEICNPNGNLVIFSNYDGGYLNIDIDVDIENLKIGIVSYDAAEITISGTYSSNVNGLTYAGYNEVGGSCSFQSIPEVFVFGVPPSEIDILTYPPVTLDDPDGAAEMSCAYFCGPGDGGGCNTPQQVVDFFLNQFPGSSLYMHYTQYQCWEDGTSYAISEGGNCCLQPDLGLLAEINQSSSTACVESCIVFNDASNGNPSSWLWTFEGGEPATSTDQNPGEVCYDEPGVYNVTLVAGTETEEQSTTIEIEILEVDYEVLISTDSLYVEAENATYQWIDCSTGEELFAEFLPALYINTEGNFACIVTQNGCIDTTECINVSLNSLAALPVQSVFSVGPSPTVNTTWVDFHTEISGPVVANLHNVQGQLVGRYSFLPGRNELNISALPSGIYRISLESNPRQSAPIVKQ